MSNWIIITDSIPISENVRRCKFIEYEFWFLCYFEFCFCTMFLLSNTQCFCSRYFWNCGDVWSVYSTVYLIYKSIFINMGNKFSSNNLQIIAKLLQSNMSFFCRLGNCILLKTQIGNICWSDTIERRNISDYFLGISDDIFRCFFMKLANFSWFLFLVIPLHFHTRVFFRISE